MSGVFDIHAIAKKFPASAETMLVDTRLTDEQEASCRVFRIYVDVPAHYHTTCDEYLFIVSGRGMFKIGELDWFDARAGQLIFFKKSTVHAISEPMIPRGTLRWGSRVSSAAVETASKPMYE